MNVRNDLEVIINNKRYTISGYESQEYLQKIASHINSKHAEFRAYENYSHLDTEVKNVLMQINLADDYYKMVGQKANIEAELAAKEKEIFELKHTLVTLQAQADRLGKELEDLGHDYKEAQKKIIELEVEARNSVLANVVPEDPVPESDEPIPNNLVSGNFAPGNNKHGSDKHNNSKYRNPKRGNNYPGKDKT